MVYNTKNGASLKKLLDKSKISGKRQWILLFEIEKKEIKTLQKFFRNYWSRLARAFSTISRQCQSSRGNFYEETDQELDKSRDTGTIPK